MSALGLIILLSVNSYRVLLGVLREAGNVFRDTPKRKFEATIKCVCITFFVTRLEDLTGLNSVRVDPKCSDWYSYK